MPAKIHVVPTPRGSLSLKAAHKGTGTTSDFVMSFNIFVEDMVDFGLPSFALRFEKVDHFRT